MLHKIDNSVVKFVSSQNNNIQLANIIVFQIRISTLDGGMWEGPKHLTLFIQAVKNSYIGRQYIQ
jgi:hypothetical protein